MTKQELIRMLKVSMFNALRSRDNVKQHTNEEQFGFYNGQYHTYEEIIDVLSRVDIETPSPDDPRSYSNM